MKYPILLFFAICFSLKLYSQETIEPKENFILLKTGEYILGDKVKQNMFTGKNVKIDGISYSFKQIVGYKQKGTYFGNHHNRFIRRVSKGAISIYVEVTESTSTGSNGATTTRRRIDEYIQKGPLGELKSLTYSNLKPMLRGDKKSLKLISNYPEIKKKSNILKAAGIGGFISGMIFGFSTVIRSSEGKNNTIPSVASLTLITAGTTSLIVGGIKASKNKKSLLAAIIEYNKNNIENNVGLTVKNDSNSTQQDNDTISTEKSTKKNYKKYENSEDKEDRNEKISKKIAKTNWSLEIGMHGYYALPIDVKIPLSNGPGATIIDGKLFALGWGINVYPKYLFLNKPKTSLSIGAPISIGLGKFVDASAMLDANWGLFAKQNKDKKTGYFIGIGAGYYTTATTSLSPMDAFGYEDLFPTINNFAPTIHAGIAFKLKSLDIYSGKGSGFVNGYRFAYKIGNSKKNSLFSISTYYKF